MTAEGRSGQAASAEKLTEPQLSRPTGPAALTLTLPMRKTCNLDQSQWSISGIAVHR
jgi:hypothetical protein